MLNASLAGFLQATSKSRMGERVLGFRNGIEGLVKGWAMDLSHLEQADLEALKRQPGAALGAGRFPLTEEGLRTVPDVLKRYHIKRLVLMGGNGTMWAGARIAELEPRIQVICVPKTIDNDLWGTDHAPGYLSAAKFVAEAVRSSALDLWSMQNFERVRVIEVMGRHVGWLAAAATMAIRDWSGFPPLQIYPPEREFSVEEFVGRTKRLLSEHPCLITVISEGVHDREGKPIVELPIGGDGSNKIVGGVSYLLTQELRKEGISCRSENLGVLQRCSTWTVSEQDRWEAERLGYEAVKLLREGKGGDMLGLARPGGRAGDDLFCLTPLKDVAMHERPLDPEFFQGMEVSNKFKDWLEAAWAEAPDGTREAERVWSITNGLQNLREGSGLG